MLHVGQTFFYARASRSCFLFGFRQCPILATILLLLAMTPWGGGSVFGVGGDDSSGRRPQPRAGSETSAGARPVPIPADVTGNAELGWRNAFGAGGALIPQVPAAEDASTQPSTFSRLVGVVFPPGEREILFVGVAEPGHARLAPEELLDAFVLAYRAMANGKSPGVSIDPTAEQLGRRLQEDDILNVVYFGDVRGTDFGYAAFECDRLMKCLSFGKDNLTKQPFGCKVPDYRSELELLADLPVNAEKESWHRFWIEQGISKIGQSHDGRTFLVDVQLAVNTQYMVVRDGELVPGNQSPDPAAKAFADHMTSHYDSYALELPVFGKLAAYAALTSVAQALQPHVADGADGPRMHPSVDTVWLLHDHQVRNVTTPTTTPAIIAERILPPEVGRILQLSGGVTIEPKNKYRQNDPVADALQRAVLDAHSRRQPERSWSVPFEGREYHVSTMRSQRAWHIWQQDLEVGAVQVVRDYSSLGQTTDFGNGWSLRRPQLKLSEETARFDDFGVAPRVVYVAKQPGEIAILPRLAMLTMPGQEPTPGYVSADGRRNLYMYSNVWTYVEGDVDFISLNGGRPKIEINNGGRVVDFSPDSQHRVQTIHAADGIIHYQYDGGQIASMRDGQGNSVQFAHDAGGKITRAEGSDGRRIVYHRDASGQLKHVLDGDGHSQSYTYNRRTGSPVAVRSELRSSPTDIQDSTRFAVLNKKAFTATESISASRYPTAVVALELTGTLGEYSVRINGSDSVRLNLDSLMELELEGDANAISTLQTQILSDEQLKGCDCLVVTGEYDMAQSVASMMRRRLHRATVFTATDGNRAVQNANARAINQQPARVFICDNLEPEIKAGLVDVHRGSEDASTVIIAGHNDPDSHFMAYVNDLMDSGALKNKDVILVTCPNTEMPGLVENIMVKDKGGAVSVTGFSQPINQDLIKPLIEGLQRRLAGDQFGRDRNQIRKDQSIDGILRETIEEIRQRAVEEFPEDELKIREQDIDVLLEHFEQIGKVFLIRQNVCAEIAVGVAQSAFSLAV